MTATWTAAAEGLAESARDLGFDAAATIASAWQARCDPDATRPLVQAAHALTSGDALPRLWDRVPACPSAADYLARAAGLEAEAAVLTRQAVRLDKARWSAREDAITEHGRQRERASQAKARLAGGEPGARAELDAACDAMQALQQAIADCEAALDVIAPLLKQLPAALTCLRGAEEAFAEAYHIPVEFVRGGGTLPWSGDFLTGARPR